MPNPRRAPLPRNKPVSKQVVKQMIKSSIASTDEMKYYASVQNITVDFSGTVLSVFQPSQGTGDTNRIGDKTLLKHVEVTYAVGAGDAQNIFRVMLIKWNQATTPVPSDILMGTGNTQAPLYPLLWDNRDKITVLYNRFHTLILNSSASLQQGTFSIPIKGRVDFSGGGTTNAVNQLYLLVISDSGAVTHPSFEYVCNVWFTDA